MPATGLTINTDPAEHWTEPGQVLDQKLCVSIAGLGLLMVNTAYQQEGNRTRDCAELASMGTVSSWSPDLKSQQGCTEIEAVLLLSLGKEGEKKLYPSGLFWVCWSS